MKYILREKNHNGIISIHRTLKTAQKAMYAHRARLEKQGCFDASYIEHPAMCPCERCKEDNIEAALGGFSLDRKAWIKLEVENNLSSFNCFFSLSEDVLTNEQRKIRTEFLKTLNFNNHHTPRQAGKPGIGESNEKAASNRK